MTSKVFQYLNDSGGSNFASSAPRPPGDGEESDRQSNGGMSTRSSGSHKSYMSNRSHSSGKSHASHRSEINQSPVGTPKKTKLDRGDSYHGLGLNLGCDDSARSASEAEGSPANSPHFTENSTPSFLKWAENFNNLLDDWDGLKLFQQFLNDEGGGSNVVDFLLACKGMKQKDDSDRDQIKCIKIINKKYIRMDQSLGIRATTRRDIAYKIANKVNMSRDIFDAALAEVENSMRENTYPLFLKSDLYVQYVQNGGESPKSSRESSGSNSARPLSGPLPTLLEDSELDLSGQDVSMSSNTSVTLTSKSLSATRISRSDSTNCRIETYHGYPPYVKRSYPYHVSYAPVSAQDSEIQSLSSDAHTDDTMSLTDSSLDGIPPHTKAWKKHGRTMRRRAEHNRDSQNNTIPQPQFIPRTERIPTDRNIAETDPKKFALQLIERLELVISERRKEEKVKETMKYLSDSEDCELKFSASKSSANTTALIPHLLQASMVTEDEDSILEAHVSRTLESPAHSPGKHSPKSKSPDRTLRKTLPSSLPGTLHQKGGLKKEKDFYSTLSFDSGLSEEKPNIYVGTETHQHIHHHHYHHHARDGKNKSQLDTEVLDNSRSRSQGRHTNNVRHSDASSNIDSGISVTEQDPNHNKVLNWIYKESSHFSQGNVTSHPESDKSSSHKRQQKHNISTKSTQQTYKQSQSKKTSALGSSRSTSIERSSVLPTWAGSHGRPNQPFAQDPSMPLLPPPNPTTQLEEAKRKLEEEQHSRPTPAKSKSFTNIPSKDKRPPGHSQSAAYMHMSFTSAKTVPSDLDLSGEKGSSRTSTMEKKGSRRPSGSATVPTTPSTPSGTKEEIVVGIYLCGEPIPYKRTWPAKKITLAQFKSLVGKRGEFDYFFKSDNNEFGTGAVFEEVKDDSVVVPMWEGKVVAKVEKRV